MPTKYNLDSALMTAFERYDRFARQNSWTPIGLSDISREHSLAELRAAAKNCIPIYLSLAFDLSCEIAWRETLQHMREVDRMFEQFKEERDEPLQTLSA